MKILFVDHAMHKLTTSSRFFLDALKAHFEVDLAFLDPDDASEESIKNFEMSQDWSSYDLVVAWQHESVAAIAAQYQVPTVIVPMYDGSAEMTETHWSLYGDCSALNFSYTLNVRSKKAIPHQKHVQYFPDPAQFKLADHSKGARVFFWMRRPEDIGIDAVMRLSRGGFETIHVHTKADGFSAERPLPDWTASYNMTSSHWFEKKTDFDDLLDQYNVMVCPRLSEGIGMVMLEGLARGMCVIAHREPTHTEYIADGVNGYLFDQYGYSPPDIRRRAHLGAMARRGVEDGYQRWRESLRELPGFMLACAMRPIRPFCSPESARLLLLQNMTDYDAYLGHVEYLARERAKTGAIVCSGAVAPAASGAAATSQAKSLVTQVPGLTFAREHVHVQPARAETGRVHRVRQMMGRVPGWRNVKSLVPLSVKKRVMAVLVDRLEGRHG